MLPEQMSPNDKKQQLADMGILMDASTGKREEYRTTQSRFQKWCNVLFSQFRCKAYIGRAWQFLVIYIKMPQRQMTAQAIYQLLYVCEDKLLLTYKKAFMEALDEI